jgi:hypothetical protein
MAEHDAEAFTGIGVEPTEHPAGSFIEADATGVDR